MPITKMSKPPENLQIRDIKEWYVDYLVHQMKNGDCEGESLTSPMVVVSSCTKTTFDSSKLGDYSFQVIGGVQRFTAITKLNSPDVVITTRKCSIYGSETPTEVLLLLAKEHNNLNQIQRVSTFPEVAGVCHRLLKSHFGDSPVPRYNTKDYRKWKSDCLRYCVCPKMVCYKCSDRG